jgi:hypothetical protein
MMVSFSWPASLLGGGEVRALDCFNALSFDERSCGFDTPADGVASNQSSYLGGGKVRTLERNFAMLVSIDARGDPVTITSSLSVWPTINLSR